MAWRVTDLYLNDCSSALVARHIGQPILAKSSLVLLSTSLQNPTSNTIDFSMRVTLTLPVPFPVLLQPMVVRLCRTGHAHDDPFLEVTLPACQIKRSTEIEVSGKRTNVLNMKQFGDFINDVMFNESVMLGINGSAKAQFHGVKSRLHLDDHVEVTGEAFFLFSGKWNMLTLHVSERIRFVPWVCDQVLPSYIPQGPGWGPFRSRSRPPKSISSDD